MDHSNFVPAADFPSEVRIASDVAMVQLNCKTRGTVVAHLAAP